MTITASFEPAGVCACLPRVSQSSLIPKTLRMISAHRVRLLKHGAGEIPNALGMLSSLTELNLSGNHLTGEPISEPLRATVF